MSYATGYTTNGERIRFERWVIEAWQRGHMRDRFLLAQLRRCVRFVYEW